MEPLNSKTSETSNVSPSPLTISTPLSPVISNWSARPGFFTFIWLSEAETNISLAVKVSPTSTFELNVASFPQLSWFWTSTFPIVAVPVTPKVPESILPATVTSELTVRSFPIVASVCTSSVVVLVSPSTSNLDVGVTTPIPTFPSIVALLSTWRFPWIKAPTCMSSDWAIISPPTSSAAIGLRTFTPTAVPVSVIMLLVNTSEAPAPPHFATWLPVPVPVSDVVLSTFCQNAVPPPDGTIYIAQSPTAQVVIPLKFVVPATFTIQKSPLLGVAVERLGMSVDASHNSWNCKPPTTFPRRFWTNAVVASKSLFVMLGCVIPVVVNATVPNNSPKNVGDTTLLVASILVATISEAVISPETERLSSIVAFPSTSIPIVSIVVDFIWPSTVNASPFVLAVPIPTLPAW